MYLQTSFEYGCEKLDSTVSIVLLDEHCFRHKEYLEENNLDPEIINTRDFLYDFIFEMQCP